MNVESESKLETVRRELPEVQEGLSPDRHAELASQAQAARNWSLSAAHLLWAFNLMPHRLDLARQLGHMLKEAGYFGAAEEAYYRYLKDNANDADINLQIGHLFLRQGRERDALPWYRKAQSLAEPGSPISADAALGVERSEDWQYAQDRRAALKLTDIRDFEAAYERLILLLCHPKGPELYGVMGNVAKELGRFSEAEEFYQRHEDVNVKIDTVGAVDLAIQRARLADARGDFHLAFCRYTAAAADEERLNGRGPVAENLRQEAQRALSALTSSISLW